MSQPPSGLPRPHRLLSRLFARNKEVTGNTEVSKVDLSAQRHDSEAGRLHAAGRACYERGDISQAEVHLREALRIEPKMTEVSVVLSTVLQESGRTIEAENILRLALQSSSGHGPAILKLAQFLVDQARFEEAFSLVESSVAVVPEALSWLLFCINNQPELNASQLYEFHARVGATLARVSGPPYVTWPNEREPAKRLKVGYVSGDFLLHPVGLLMKPVLENHDRAGFDIHCFSNNRETDPVTQLLWQLAPTWHDIADLSDHQFTELVRGEDIDILVDLSGHTDRHRMQAFARHPAPVQVTWLGYLNTTGLPTMDYRICDSYTDPPGVTDAFHTEKLVRMPNSQWCYDPWVAPTECSHDATSGERIVFGSVNRYKKITDDCLALWCRILDAVPGAELVILDVPEKNRAALLNRFVERNVDRSRLSVFGRQLSDAYYRNLGSLDVALDTFPYNGATTTLDTLWMGTPVVALRGERGISRGGYSILWSMNASELIAANPEEYVDLNVRLASDPAWRRTLHTTLRDRLRASPLMDVATFVADLEAAYRFMWQKWCKTSGVVV